MKAIALVSSGIDSPVATYLMKKKGIEILPLFFVNADPSETDIVKDLMKTMGIDKILVADHTKTQETIKSNCDPRFQCVLCKRIMYRVAKIMMEKYDCKLLITGDNLGQVASQTLENMQILSECIDTDVIRPIFCKDKMETVAIARKIGTYDLSVKNTEKCPFVPTSPVTKARLDFVKKQEKKIDINKLVDNAVKSCELL